MFLLYNVLSCAVPVTSCLWYISECVLNQRLFKLMSGVTVNFVAREPSSVDRRFRWIVSVNRLIVNILELLIFFKSFAFVTLIAYVKFG